MHVVLKRVRYAKTFSAQKAHTIIRYQTETVMLHKQTMATSHATDISYGKHHGTDISNDKQTIAQISAMANTTANTTAQISAPWHRYQQRQTNHSISVMANKCDTFIRHSSFRAVGCSVYPSYSECLAWQANTSERQ